MFEETCDIFGISFPCNIKNRKIDALLKNELRLKILA